MSDYKYFVSFKWDGKHTIAALRLGKRATPYQPGYETVEAEVGEQFVYAFFKGEMYRFRKSRFYGHSWRYQGFVKPCEGRLSSPALRPVIEEPKPQGVTLEELFAEDQ